MEWGTMNKRQQLEKARNYFIELVRGLYKIGDGRDGSEEWRLPHAHGLDPRGPQRSSRWPCAAGAPRRL